MSVADPQSFNRYSYVQNDPVNFIDPTGLSCLFVQKMWWVNDKEVYSVDVYLCNDGGGGGGGGGQDGRGGPIGGGGGGGQPQNPGVTVTVSAQIPPMEQVDCPGGAAESASGRGNTVILNYADGTREVRRGGSRSWRNDNPGNIRPGNLQGEIGSAGGFAVFSSESAGQSAIVELLGRRAYQALTVGGAIARWAPPTENDTGAYQARVQNLTGINADTEMSTLTQDQLQSVANAIRSVEGWTAGTRTCWRQRAQ